MQENPHEPDVQVAEAPAGTGHAVQDVPHEVTSVFPTHEPEQSWKPALHASRQAPAAHRDDALTPDGQAAAHEPQWAEALERSTSQPSAAAPLQSPKPALQRNPQAPEAQVGLALGRAGQALPHEPHEVTSDARFRQEPEQ